MNRLALKQLLRMEQIRKCASLIKDAKHVSKFGVLKRGCQLTDK